MKLVLLDAETLGEDLDLSPLGEFGELSIYPTTSPNETLKRVLDADIVITNKVLLKRDILKEAKNLKLICIAATGMNNVDLESAKEFGIEVKNVSGYSTNSVAQHTFALLFSLLEQIEYYDNYVKSKEWSKSPIFTHLKRPFYEINNKEWGVIGLGAIGKKVAKLATAFGANVSYYATSGVIHSNEYPHKELKELLKSSDIVSIHAPLNEKTKGLIGSEELALMKNKSILINVGRGGIIDEDALAKELNRREIYAGLDVTENEPLKEESPLLKLKYPDRIIITPHIAWTSIEARKELLNGIVKNIESFISAKS